MGFDWLFPDPDPVEASPTPSESESNNKIKEDLEKARLNQERLRRTRNILSGADELNNIDSKRTGVNP